MPNSSTYMDGIFQGLIPMPVGATGIIAESESLDTTDVKFQFDGKIKFFFNDPAKTPVDKITISGSVRLNDVTWNDVGITETTTGYGLKFNRLDETVVDTLLMEGTANAYGYIGGGSNTFNWIRDAKAIDEKTVTFTCYVMGKASTDYEVWFSNSDVKCSSHSTRITLTIEP